MRGLRSADTLAPVQNSPGLKLIGIVLVLLLATGFVLESAWLFLAALVVFFGWVGYLLLGPEA